MTEKKQIIIREKSTLRKETNNSYLQLQGTEIGQLITTIPNKLRVI